MMFPLQSCCAICQQLRVTNEDDFGSEIVVGKRHAKFRADPRGFARGDSNTRRTNTHFSEC
jgi:hypothetical protein